MALPSKPSSVTCSLQNLALGQSQLLQAEMWKWKRLNFRSGSTLMKESGNELGSDQFHPELEAEAKTSKGEEVEANSEA